MANTIQQRQVLVVLKEPEIVPLVNSVLKTNNLVAHVFTDPALALDKFKKNSKSISLILFDMTIKGMSAFEFLREARVQNSDVKFVLISSIAIKSTEFAMMLPTVRIDGFIEKNLLQDTIVPMIGSLLDLQKAKMNVGK